MWKTILLGAIMTVAHGQAHPQPIHIVTVDSPQHFILHSQTEEIQSHEFALAQEIGEKLLLALKPYFPAAGLAAPQIGINKAVFIYSYDRDPKNLEIVINPTFTPIGEDKVEGWEGCLSVITTTWKIAKVPRHEKIRAVYLNHKGEWIEKDLEGFAAKVFQHEYDHLQGIVNIDRHDALVKQFATKQELEAFMQSVKKEDATRYKNPNQ
jgi:peptide deformylase